MTKQPCLQIPIKSNFIGIFSTHSKALALGVCIQYACEGDGIVWFEAFLFHLEK